MKQPKTIKKLLEFLNEYSNPDHIPEGQPRRFGVSNLMRYTIGVYGGAYFKWVIESKDFEEVAKYLKTKITKKDKILKLTTGDEDYQIELERAEQEIK
jgi:hypothetical protein